MWAMLIIHDQKVSDVNACRSIAMNRSVKPPRVVMVRPKSAGSVRRLSQVTTSRTGETPTETLSTSPAICAHPVRPTNKSAKRPASANTSRRRSEGTYSSARPSPRFASTDETINTLTWTQNEPAANSPEEVSNVYYAVAARKDAEDVAQQLARRIARFRSQEERVLREMHMMRTQLERNLTTPALLAPVASTASALSKMLAPSHRIHLQSRNTSLPNTDTQPGVRQAEPASICKRKLIVPRSREQLSFLAKRRQSLEAHKHEAARQQKERRKAALAEQKAKEEEQERKRRSHIARIRTEEQQVLELRTEKQRQVRQASRKQHHERLVAERQRQQKALGLIAEMEEEEKNLRLRLEALQFHRGVMQQELRGGVPPFGDS